MWPVSEELVQPVDVAAKKRCLKRKRTDWKTCAAKRNDSDRCWTHGDLLHWAGLRTMKGWIRHQDSQRTIVLSLYRDFRGSKARYEVRGGGWGFVER